MKLDGLGALFLLLAVTGCTGSGDQSDAIPSPTSEPCNIAGATTVPASCIPGEGGSFDAIPSESGSPPSDSAKIPPLTSPSEPGQLATGGNDKDATLTTRRFTVTLPAGQRLRTTLACQGAHHVILKTEPKSAAEQEFACGYTEPTELSVEDSVVATAATTYVVTVTAQAPARWYVVISGTSEPLPGG